MACCNKLLFFDFFRDFFYTSYYVSVGICKSELLEDCGRGSHDDPLTFYGGLFMGGAMVPHLAKSGST